MVLLHLEEKFYVHKITSMPGSASDKFSVCVYFLFMTPVSRMRLIYDIRNSLPDP